ncbi:hypothetical protein G3I44_14415 [Halogeometricum borinquense]|uniref:Uncharacterized protein n=1 Tax=Halogeometricum borinquense TaxID=60847 RepID=A0A6C0UJL7_9EURY|nr:hypothetical protein [Halogeometricum borinquense]QIB75380.1 hypothetical protein G3I44_14415 [Halogeometricum borinquense]
MKRLTLLSACLFLFITTTAALNVSINQSTTTLNPGTTAQLGEILLVPENETATLTGVTTSGIPFDVTYLPNQTLIQNATRMNISAAVPDGAAPQSFTGSATLVFQNRSSESVPVELTVNRSRSWAVNRTPLKHNVSVASTGILGNVSIKNTGNVPVTLSVNLTGNISQVLEDVRNEVTVYPGNADTLQLEYDVDRDQEFGPLTGRLSFQDETRNTSLNLSTVVEDTIPPRLDTTEFPDVMATQELTATVYAADNLEVGRVLANVSYVTTEQVGNSTTSVNETHETMSFRKRGHAWTATLDDTSRPGNYTVTGVIIDTAGHRVNFTDQFTISPLDGIDTLGNITFPTRRYDTEAKLPLGALKVDTPITINLTYFDKELDGDDENWDVAIVTENDGKKYFTPDDRSVTVDEEGPVELYVYSDTSGRFNGELVFDGVDSHIPIPSTSFDGRFTEWAQPQDWAFDMFRQNYECLAVQSDVREKAGWDCSTFIPATAIPTDSTLAQEADLLVPQSQKDEVIQPLETNIAELQTSLLISHVVIAILVLALFSGGAFAWYLVRIYPGHYFVWLKDTERWVR